MSKKNTKGPSENRKESSFPFLVWIKKNWLYLLILAALVFIAYGNALNGAFVSDDIAEIRDNPDIQNFSYILTHLNGFIRPLSYWIAFHIGGLNPWAFRMVNIIFHLGSIFVIFKILEVLYSKKIALLTAIIFAIHPLLVEPVTWISGGQYPQYSFFFLLSFLFYILSKDNNKLFFVSILFFLLSFMSHTVMPASLILIYTLYEYSFGNLKKNWWKTFPYILVTIIYIFINLVALPQRIDTLQNVHYQERGIDNPFVQVPVAITSYLQLMFWPKDLTLYHSELSFDSFLFILMVIIFIAFLSLIVFGFFKNKIIFFWLSFFFISLWPTLTPFRLNWIVAERYVYLGSLGVFVLIILGIERVTKFENLKKIKNLDYIAISLITLLLLVRTITRNVDWQNEDNLWIATGKTSPSSPNTHNNLGDVYGRRGDKEGALKEFQTAITLKPNYADAYHNLANTYQELGQSDLALENYKKAATINPYLWQSYQNIAAIYYMRKEYNEAKKYIEQAITINPKNLSLKNNLGIIYLSLGEKEKAKNAFTEVLNQNPNNQLAKQGLTEASK